ncbi:MAG: hypothetical protein LBB16_02675 [Puniceicoccales bacterium]|jgi:hypothetical protein|nr:hypothetical protein [Puniceicoccales bacterium]
MNVKTILDCMKNTVRFCCSCFCCRTVGNSDELQPLLLKKTTLLGNCNLGNHTVKTLSEFSLPDAPPSESLQLKSTSSFTLPKPTAPQMPSASEPLTAPLMSPQPAKEQLQQNIDVILAQISYSISLANCILDQQTYIIQYGMDMIRDGNKPEWAAQVCASMAILYQSGIEQHIPDQITIEDNQTPEAITRSKTDLSSVVFAQQFIAQRAVATKHLAKVMSANGADYTIMSDYLKRQRFSSWSRGCLVLKYFLLQQRTDWVEDARSIYYFEGNKRKGQNLDLQKLQKAYDTHFLSADHAKYTKTVAMYTAFTAMALRKTQFDGKDSAQRTCLLQRAMTRADLIASYEEAYKML